ncbi:MAG TPA: transcriptional activator RfaH [Candidatus Acidoferrales bacterium]|jgi:transcriptional antiterminator RfaH|nr:transcriptional activator RfaH [Candidatus Acidoferrales bacterium]
MQTITQAWYSARTKPKHEHIAAASLRKNLGLDVFSPGLRLEKLTRRGLVSVTEPLFPCYIFVRCVLEEQFNDIQHTVGVNRLVNFGGKIPEVADEVIAELRDCFENEEIIQIDTNLRPGDEVTVAGGAFAGMSAHVLKSLPAKKRVQILLEILGRPTMVEVERETVILTKNSLADLAPALAAPVRRETLSA